MAVFILVTLFELSGSGFHAACSNQRQDEYRNVIKGRAPQTYRDPQRKWMAGSEDRIYHYSHFDPNLDLFGGISIFEFKPNTFELITDLKRSGFDVIAR